MSEFGKKYNAEYEAFIKNFGLTKGPQSLKSYQLFLASRDRAADAKRQAADKAEVFKAYKAYAEKVYGHSGVGGGGKKANPTRKEQAKLTQDLAGALKVQGVINAGARSLIKPESITPPVTTYLNMVAWSLRRWKGVQTAFNNFAEKIAEPATNLANTTAKAGNFVAEVFDPQISAKAAKINPKLGKVVFYSPSALGGDILVNLGAGVAAVTATAVIEGFGIASGIVSDVVQVPFDIARNIHTAVDKQVNAIINNITGANRQNQPAAPQGAPVANPA